jgi:hypothetical protein
MISTLGKNKFTLNCSHVRPGDRDSRLTAVEKFIEISYCRA